jgi:hypothetical protein
MADNNPSLEVFHQEWIGELEEARFARLTGGQAQINYREVSEASTSTLRPMSVSRESTHTITGDMTNLKHEVAAPCYSGDEMDLDSPQTPNMAQTPDAEESLIVATDFGTTFSAVAFVRRRKDKREQVEVISNYPGDGKTFFGGSASVQVPTESWYPDQHQIQESFLNPTSHNQVEDPYRGLYDDSYADEDQNSEGELDAEPTMELDPRPTRDAPNFVWGYGIHRLIRPDADLTQFNQIAKSKLLLDNSPRTQSIREELRPIIERLKNKKKKPGRTSLVKTDEDIIADYLTQLLLHTKEQLATQHGVPNNIAIEHVLCVPVVWNAKACRTMERAMETAIKDSGLGTSKGLFLVPEPEAAAAYIIGKNKEVNVRRSLTAV